MIKLTWSQLKSLIDAKGIAWQVVYIENDDFYDVYLSARDFSSYCKLMKTEAQDFEDNYKSLCNSDAFFVNGFDETGRAITRFAATEKGWHYQALFLEYETSKGVLTYCKDEDGNDLSDQFIILRLDANGDVTQNEIDCVRSLVIYKPSHDYEIITGNIRSIEKPLMPVRVFASGGLMNEASKYESLSVLQFTRGGLNLQYQEFFETDGRASKLARYQTVGAPFPTNRLKWSFHHNAGYNHKVLLSLEIFLA